jgi:hypothetical protein
MLKPNQAVVSIVARPRPTSAEPAADKPPDFDAGLEIVGRATGGSTGAGSVAAGADAGESAARSTQPAAAGIAASTGISNFGLDLRRARGRPADGLCGDPLVPGIVLSAY